MDVEGRVQSTAERKTDVLKGSCAQFLRQNPRFLNEPICHLLPNETSRSVADCMQWTQEEVPTAVQNVFSLKAMRQFGMESLESRLHVQYHPDLDLRAHSLDSTSRADYQPSASDKRSAPSKHRPPDNINRIAPLSQEEPSPVRVKERISFRHQYNSRTDPNEPVRGKLHGSFVWEAANRGTESHQ